MKRNLETIPKQKEKILFRLQFTLKPLSPKFEKMTCTLVERNKNTALKSHVKIPKVVKYRKLENLC